MIQEINKTHIKKIISSACLIVITLFLFSCASVGNNGLYTVKKGDTLSTIASKHGMKASKLQKINGISNPNKIKVGQRLKVSGNATYKTSGSSKSTTKAKPIKKAETKVVYAGKSWVWPISGKVLSNFKPGRIGGNGIRIAGKETQTVNAAQSGTVAYKGSGLNGYGNVVIIKHGNGLLSAYGFLSKTFVKEGQKVSKRQKIGIVGHGGNRRLMLHFEVRKNANPVNPKIYIGSKYHF